MRCLKVTLAYDGTNYAGWQVQQDQVTVQSEFESALEKITGERIRVVASGRTDAGVHALGQVASFRTPSRLATDEFLAALNANLPRDIRVSQVQEAPADFHAIRDATGKRYRYAIQDGPVADVFLRRYSWFVPKRIDEQAMQRSATALIGTHDFSSFEASGSARSSSVRTACDLTVTRLKGEQSHVITIEVEADGFLYNMVRNIVGTLVEVGRGAQDEGWPERVLRLKDRSQAGPTAPACGLVLLRVDYAA